MNTCSQHLLGLLEGNYLKHKVPKMISQPILPQLQGESFVSIKLFIVSFFQKSIMECNTLELARQLCLVYYNLFSKIQVRCH